MADSDLWHPLFAMPNLSIGEPVEVQDVVAIVPPNDGRLVAARKRDRCADGLFGRFADQFGEPFVPAALLVSASAPKHVFSHHALTSFRNVVALACLATSWSRANHWPARRFSDAFDFYPYTPTRGGDLRADSLPLRMHIESPDDFQGQQAPHFYPPNPTWAASPEDRLLAACERLWRERYLRQEKRWKTRVVFRSLELAAQATRVPGVGSQVATVHDFGTSLVLWVSGFEILKRNRNDRASLPKVLELLGNWEWGERSLRHRKYRVRHRGKTYSVNFVQKLYSHLYFARCAFVHGNPVTPTNLFAGSGRAVALVGAAPLLYRVALLSYIDPPAPRRRRAAFMQCVREVGFERSVWELQQALSSP